MVHNARLFYPLDQGLIDPIEVACIWRARPNFALHDRSGISVMQSFKPWADQLSAMGLPVVGAAPDDLTHAIVEITRSKIETLGLIAEAVTALPPNGWCMIDGAKTDGVDSILKQMRRLFGPVEAYSKAHGRVIWFQRPDALPEQLADWSKAAEAKVIGAYTIAPGIFGETGIDNGSALLVKTMPTALSGKGADLGAGWGYLASFVLDHADVTSLTLVEAEGKALECARVNITDPRAEFLWEDATQPILKDLDFIVMNPPFHNGRAADPEIGKSFIRAASKSLARSGKLYMVANRHLPYEDTLDQSFIDWQVAAQTNQFKVIFAKRPKSK